MDLDRPPTWWHSQATDHMAAHEARTYAGTTGALLPSLVLSAYAVEELGGAQLLLWLIVSWAWGLLGTGSVKSRWPEGCCCCVAPYSAHAWSPFVP